MNRPASEPASLPSGGWQTKAARLALLLLGFAELAGAQESRSATLYVEKIFCSACAVVVNKALRGVAGVADVSIDVDKKEVVVRFDPAKTNTAELTAATAKRGFPSTVRDR